MIKKIGYDFHTTNKGFRPVIFDVHKRFPDSKIWSDYTQEKPYLFKAWKIEHNDQLISNYSKRYYFYPDQLYSVVLDTEERRYFKGEGKGSFDLLFTRSEKSWQLELMAPQGGFIESDDLYMNLAPESGYQETITMDGKFSYAAKANKQFYLKTTKGQYAKLILKIRPYFRKESLIEFDYTINLDGNHNLAIVEDRENEILW